MDDNKYARNIELVCPTCGGSQFEYGDDIEDDEENVRCIGCDRVLTKAELIEANSENIDEHAKEIGKEAVADLAKKMKKDLRKAFKGNKNIKFK